MEKKYVIAYYGERFNKVYTHFGWQNQSIGLGILSESKPLSIYPTFEEIVANRPDIKFEYAIVEERYY